MKEKENTDNKTRDSSKEQEDLEINIASRHQAMERILRDIREMVGDGKMQPDEEARARLDQGLAEREGSHAEPTSLDRAQELVYRAWEVTGQERADLALQALHLSKNCADAYIILGEETARSPEEAMRMYELGVRAGERALGVEPFKESVGELWDIVEARPYMRARTKLARSLWDLGHHRRAIIHYKELLRLDSGDSQGIRYALMNCLLEEGLHHEVKELIVEYRGDQTAAWLYSRALWAFVRFGAGVRAGTYLKEALEANRFIPEYILGFRNLPGTIPDYFGWGDENEAIVYAVDSLNTWKKIDGAQEWLSENLSSKSGTSD